MSTYSGRAKNSSDVRNKIPKCCGWPKPARLPMLRCKLHLLPDLFLDPMLCHDCGSEIPPHQPSSLCYERQTCECIEHKRWLQYCICIALFCRPIRHSCYSKSKVRCDL